MLFHSTLGNCPHQQMCSTTNISLPVWAIKLQFLHRTSWDFGSTRRQQAHWLCLELQREPIGWSFTSFCEIQKLSLVPLIQLRYSNLSFFGNMFPMVNPLAIVRSDERNYPVFAIIWSLIEESTAIPKKRIEKLSYPQDSHMAIPGTVLGLFHHTCPSLVEQVAHLIVDSPIDEPYKDVSSSSTLDLSPIRILPKEGGPRVLFWRAWDTLTRRCCRRASFSTFSLSFFQIYEKRRISEVVRLSILLQLITSRPPFRSNSASKTADSSSVNYEH